MSIQQGAWDYVPNYAKSFSHRPEVMARWGKLLAELQRPMDKRRLEMMHFACQVARDASTVDAADVDRLKDHGFSDAEVFDIAAVAAGRAFFTKVLDAVGSLPDAGFHKIDEQLRTELTVGRPISGEDDEVMNSVSDS